MDAIIFVEIKNEYDANTYVNKVKKEEPFFVVCFRDDGSSGCIDITYYLSICKSSFFVCSSGGVRRGEFDVLRWA